MYNIVCILYIRGSENKGWVIAVRAIKIIHSLGRWRPDNNRQRNRVVNMLMILELSLLRPVASCLQISSSQWIGPGYYTKTAEKSNCKFWFFIERMCWRNKKKLKRREGKVPKGFNPPLPQNIGNADYLRVYEVKGKAPH